MHTNKTAALGTASPLKNIICHYSEQTLKRWPSFGKTRKISLWDDIWNL